MMSKMIKIILFAVLMITSSFLFATAQEGNPLERAEYRTSFLVCYTPYNMDKTEVDGLKLGLPMSSGRGEVNGLEFAIISTDTSMVYGVQSAMFVDMVDVFDGAQAAFLANMARESSTGAQLSFVNFEAKELYGAQVGLFNYSKTVKGLQLGIVNDADNLSDLQIGILNYNTKAWIPLLPFINFSPKILRDWFPYF